MKLQTKTNIQYITFSIIAYLLITLVFYLVTEYVIYEEVEYRLEVERQDFEHYIKEHGVWESSCYFVENKIELTKVTDTLKPIEPFKDTLFSTTYSNQIDPFRQYSFYAVVNNEPYIVNIRKSLIESNKLLTFITGTMLILFSVVLMVLFFLQRKFSTKTWKPFYDTLHIAKSFELDDGKGGIQMPDVALHEFNELNRVLEKMTKKIALDYQSLKEFTENAAHEIQTPLALISSRIEELIQDKNFTNKQMYLLEEIHRSTIRLSKLHQGLLLLSKIDNGQFYKHEKINISALFQHKIVEFEELFTHKNITVEFDNQNEFIMEMHPILADILVGNLLNNAVRHNTLGGKIIIISSKTHLKISNTGASYTHTEEPSKFFERFKKQSQHSDSLGLGLAIVNKICQYHKMTITYEIANNIHSFELKRL